jgi:phosphatidylinositol kinase/protein kinase (PI-3  family)
MPDDILLKASPRMPPFLTQCLTSTTQYMMKTMNSPAELWRMRKQFTTQLAATCFMTYILCLTSRLPSRFHLSRATGQIAMSELLPSTSSQAPVFASSDVVPFRLTPSLQRFIGSVFQEGILVPSLMAIGRGLTEPEVGVAPLDPIAVVNIFCISSSSSNSFACSAGMKS